MIANKMVSAEFIAVLGGLIAGALGGFLYSLAGWFRSEDKFDSKKNLSAVFLGILGGVSAAVMQFDSFAHTTSDYQLLGLYVTLVLSASGVAALVPRAIKAATKDTSAQTDNTATTATDAATTTSTVASSSTSQTVTKA